MPSEVAYVPVIKQECAGAQTEGSGKGIRIQQTLGSQPVETRGDGVRIAIAAQFWAYVLASDPENVGPLVGSQVVRLLRNGYAPWYGEGRGPQAYSFQKITTIHPVAHSPAYLRRIQLLLAK